MMKHITIAAVLSVSVVTGCASVTRGVNNDVVIQYTPSDAIATTSLNHRCDASPCTVRIPRKDAMQVTVQKPGFQTQTVSVNTRLAGAGAAGFAGNVLLGGVVGMGVDAATGATLEHFPNPVVVDLVPEGVSSDSGSAPAGATPPPTVATTPTS
ncbi:MAG: translation initiation factor 2 [Pseudomonadota bacterium]